VSRSLLAFLTFCLLLLLVSAGLVWYVGLTLTGIVFDAERRDSPYYLLQLVPLEYVEPGGEAASYRARFVVVAAEDEGRLAWQAGRLEVTDGHLRPHVDELQLLEFASGRSVVRMLTSDRYRELKAALGPDSVHLLGSSQGPPELAADEATVVVLYRQRAAAAHAPLGEPGLSGWLTLLPRFGGSIGWDAPLEVIRGGSVWNRALLLQFPDAEAAEAWFADPVTATERAIARRSVDSMVVLLARPDHYGWP
jgi:uncharacterized protein (DUF1330 family)